MLNCEEIKINLHNYLDGNLNKVTSKEMEVHLKSCPECFKKYTKTASILDQLKDLPGVVDLPFNIREKLSEEFMKISGGAKFDETPIPKQKEKKLKKEKIRLEKELKKPKGIKRRNTVLRTKMTRPRDTRAIFYAGINIKRIAIVVLALFLVAGSYTAYDLLKINSPWEVEWKYGAYLINGVENANLELSKNETLRTPDSSAVILFVPQTGRIELNSNSSVTLINPKNGDNIVKLNSGKIKVITTAIVPYLKVNYRDLIIRDIGGVFTITSYSKETANIFVDFGMVEIFYKTESFRLDEGYNCEIIGGKKPGIPFRFDATDSLKKLIHAFNNAEEGDSYVEAIIAQSGASDALTLLALIPKVQPIKRQLIFQKINNYFPLPKEVTRMGIVTLDADMLEAWWNDIEWKI